MSSESEKAGVPRGALKVYEGFVWTPLGGKHQKRCEIRVLMVPGDEDSAHLMVYRGGEVVEGDDRADLIEAALFELRRVEPAQVPVPVKEREPDLQGFADWTILWMLSGPDEEHETSFESEAPPHRKADARAFQALPVKERHRLLVEAGQQLSPPFKEKLSEVIVRKGGDLKKWGL